jgi:hypothetical protein
MEAPIYLRPAQIQDLIDGTHLIANRVYFEKSTDGHFEGPYVIHDEDTWIRDMFYRIIQHLVYVLHYEPTADALICTLNFKIAEPDDLKEYGQLKYGFSYYLMANDVLNGPFLITQHTKVKDLAEYLKEQRVYIPEHKSLQYFKGLHPAIKAS